MDVIGPLIVLSVNWILTMGRSTSTVRITRM